MRSISFTRMRYIQIQTIRTPLMRVEWRMANNNKNKTPAGESENNNRSLCRCVSVVQKHPLNAHYTHTHTPQSNTLTARVDSI